MLRSADVEVHVTPVLIRLAAHERLVVVRIHIAQIVGAAAREARHRAQLERPAVDGPVFGAAERRFARLRRLVLAADIRQLERQVLHRQRRGDTVLEIDGERLAPVALAREDGVAQAEIDLAVPQTVRFHIIDGGRNSLLDCHSVQETGVAHDAVLGVETFLRDVASLDERNNRQVKSLGKGIVAAVVRRNSHDGAGTVAGEHVFGNPDGNLLLGQRVEGVRAGEDTRGLARFGDALALGLFLGLGEVFIHRSALFGRSEFVHPLALGRQHHEGDAEDRVGTRGEDGHVVGLFAVGDFEDNLGTLAAANPVALHLLEGVGPLEAVQFVEQALGVGRHAQLPLFHLFLFHREAAADREALLDFVVGQHRTQRGAPVDRGFTLVGNAVLHQQVGLLLFGETVPAALFLQLCDEGVDGFGLVGLGVVPVVEHLQEGPLRPFVVGRIAGAHLARPVVGETDPVHLLAVAVDVLLRGDGGMLPGLDGILLGGETEGVVTHRVQDVEALQPFVAAVDVAGNVAQRMAHMQPGPGGVRKHVEHIILGLGGVGLYAEGLAVGPVGLPFLLDFLEIVFHPG